ncbi:MAG: hypothetical protein AAF235_10890, partial [Planctomycetota bacterium]
PAFARTYDPSKNFFVQLARFLDLDTIVINNPIGGRDVTRHLRDDELRTVDLAIVRDGRAVVSSYLRRQTGSDFLTTVRDWFAPHAIGLGAVYPGAVPVDASRDGPKLGMRGGLLARLGLSPRRRQVRRDFALVEQYERVIAAPKAYLLRAAAVIGGSYPETATSFWLHLHHLCSANPGPVGTFRRYAGVPFTGPDAESQEERYLAQIASPDTPPLDLRWTNALDERDRAVFDHFAGSVNASWGYERDAVSDAMRLRVCAEQSGRAAEPTPGVLCDDRTDGAAWDPSRRAVPPRSFDAGGCSAIGTTAAEENAGVLG